MYPDNDDPDYYGIRRRKNLFGKAEEDYYKPIKTKGAFNNNCIEYETKTKNYQLKNIFLRLCHIYET